MRRALRHLANLYLITALFTPLAVWAGYLLAVRGGETDLPALPIPELLITALLLVLPLLSLRVACRLPDTRDQGSGLPPPGAEKAGSPQSPSS